MKCERDRPVRELWVRTLLTVFMNFSERFKNDILTLRNAKKWSFNGQELWTVENAHTKT
jgi:hypothetical protein